MVVLITTILLVGRTTRLDNNWSLNLLDVVAEHGNNELFPLNFDDAIGILNKDYQYFLKLISM